MPTLSLKRMIHSSLAGVIAYLLARFTKFVLFLAAPFLKMDFGEVPLLLIACIGDWKLGLTALAIKELLSLTVSGSNPFGLLADFMVCGAFIFVTAKVLKGNSKPLVTLAAISCGALVRTIVGIPVNLIILRLQFGTNAADVLAQMVYILPFNLAKSFLGGASILYLLPRLKGPLSKSLKIDAPVQ